MTSKDFEKFSKKHLRLNSSMFDSYRAKMNFTHHVLDDGSDGMMVDIFSKLINNRIIFLSQEMESDTCNIIKAQLLYLEQLSKDEDIKLYIDCPGGSVYSGLGLLDTMEFIKPDIVTINTGLAASMAAVILCSGAKGKRKALRRSRTMIHQPLAGFGGYLQASDLEIDAKEINSLKKELHNIISDKTGKSYDRVEKDSDRDYWMTSQEALDYGMIDEIIKPR